MSLQGRMASKLSADRARRAVDVALRFLRERQQNDRVRALAERAELLRSEIEGWRIEPPTLAARERAVLRALSIHLEAVALSRGSPQPQLR